VYGRHILHQIFVINLQGGDIQSVSIIVLGQVKSQVKNLQPVSKGKHMQFVNIIP